METFDYGDDIYTEADGDDDTLANLGPLRPLAGIWASADGTDLHPVRAGSDITGQVIDDDEHNAFVEHYELQPIDPQTNGPQLFYGLRYHTHIVKPGEVETFHDQVGYWLWEPAARTVVLSLAIPRGQVVLAAGAADPDATQFEISSALGSEMYGILSNPFLDRAFKRSASARTSSCTTTTRGHTNSTPRCTFPRASASSITSTATRSDESPSRRRTRSLRAPSISPRAKRIVSAPAQSVSSAGYPF
jgi:hypothetical protein